MPKKNNNFEKAYSSLNSNQKIAVDQIDGPVMVVAGPGTGKTQTIAVRIANVLTRTDTDPDAILALTFTETGARAMRTRLAEMIGSTAYYVNISTFHSFCVQVIRDNPDYFTLDPSRQPLSDLESLKIIRQILDETSFDIIKPTGSIYHYSKALISSIRDLKREGVSPEDLENFLKSEEKALTSEVDISKTKLNIKTREINKNNELLEVYRRYESTLSERKIFDFEDMINTTVASFESNVDLLTSYQERFHYFLVDEFQDSNNAQNELLLLLASHWGEDANVFVVGDPDQSIYRFQGASIENQLSFVRSFPTAIVVTLTDNYRSRQEILDISDSLISHNNLRINDVVKGLDPHLKSTESTSADLALANLSTNTAELIFLADDINKRIQSGADPTSIAVIYRNNKESVAISEILEKYRIDYSVQGGANILEDPTVKNFVKLLRVVSEMRRREEDEDLFTILHYEIFSIEPLDVLKISRVASERRLTLFDIIADQKILNSANLESPSKLDETLSLLAHFSELDANTTFPELFESVLNKSGYLKWILDQPDAHHRISRINALFDEVKHMITSDHSLNLNSFLENIDLMNDNNIRVEESTYGKSTSAITLTTAHSAKGLEWDHVYISKAIDSNWGNSRVRDLIKLPGGIIQNTNISDKERNEDERRLFYVALTRARKSITLTYSDSYSLHGRTRAASPSMFISELGDASLKTIDTSAIESEAREHLEKILAARDESDPSEKELEFLRELVSKFSLSITALNSYLECPYKFKLDKLLRVPRSKKPHLAFGTAIHKSLEAFYQKLKNDNSLPTSSFLIDEFEKALTEEILTSQDHALRLNQGRKLLKAYYDLFKNDFKEPLFLEKYFRVQLEDITLTGKIDRIEWHDQKARTIKVTDYKTGKPKTKGQIEGATKDSTGELKRQLVFYKLLIDLDSRLKNVKFQVAELDFVASPIDKNKPGRHSVVIKSDEVDSLRKLIKKVMTDIRSLKFPRTTDYNICKTCAFQDHCWPEGIPN